MKSIRRSLRLWSLSGLLVILGLGGAGLYAVVRSVLVSDFDHVLRAKAQTLATLIKSEDGQVEVEFLTERMAPPDREGEADYFEVWSGDGTLLGKSESLGDAGLAPHAGSFDAPDFRNVTLPGGRPGRAAGIRFRPINEVEEGGRAKVAAELSPMEITLVLAKDRSGLDKNLAAIGAGIGLISAFMIAAAAFLIGVSVRRGLWPLDRLGERVASIEAANLSDRLAPDEMPDELKPICARLNDLLARLDLSFQRERRFSANVSHELRTPIAELRSLAEVALKYPEDESAYARTIRDALAIAVQMQNLVETLLWVSRCQSGHEFVRRESVSVFKLVEEIWRPLEAPARARNLSVENQLRPDAALETDPRLFRTIVQNLLSNAVSYTPAGGRIGIDAMVSNGRFELRVINSCESLTPDDIPHLTEPFWRKDPSRTNSDHAGLGLTLATECVRLLAMDLTATLESGNRLRVSLRAR